MKKKHVLAISVLAAALAGVSVSIYLFRKNKRKRRLAVISDAGYETAPDIHYPVKYRRGKSAEL